MKTVREIQTKLAEIGYDLGPIDGKSGPKTKASIQAYQKSVGLHADGIAGPKTLAVLFPTSAAMPASKFDAGSARRLARAHPKIQEVMNEARKQIESRVLDSQRGRAAQEKAFKEGHSKAHFGQSAHNWDPAIAVDLFPAPYDWKDAKSFDRLAGVVMSIALEKDIPLRWGGDWNMDGNPKDGWDKPHYELHPWREWAKSAKPFNG